LVAATHGRASHRNYGENSAPWNGWMESAKLTAWERWRLAGELAKEHYELASETLALPG